MGLWDFSPRLRFVFGDEAIWNTDHELVAEWYGFPPDGDTFEYRICAPGYDDEELRIVVSAGPRKRVSHDVWDPGGRYLGAIRSSRLVDSQDTVLAVLQARTWRGAAWTVADHRGDLVAEVEREDPIRLRDWLFHTIWQLRMETPLPRDTHALVVTSVFWCHREWQLRDNRG